MRPRSEPCEVEELGASRVELSPYALFLVARNCFDGAPRTTLLARQRGALRYLSSALYGRPTMQ